MKRVKVDFSATVQGGLIKANLKRASEPLQVGDDVEAYDPAEDMEFAGVVDHLSDDGRFAFLRMDWEDNTTVYNRPGVNLVVPKWSEPPILAQRPHGTSSGAADELFVPPPLHVGTPPPVVTPAEHLMPA